MPEVTLLGVFLSQAYLLGLWMAFSETGLWSRLLVLGMGAVYMEVLIAVVGDRTVNGAAATTSLVTAGMFLAARQWGRQLRRIMEPDWHEAARSYQIKIQELMILTFVLALLFAGARGMREMGHQNLILTAIFSLCNVGVDIAAVWAALGLAQPIKRLPVVFLLSLCSEHFFGSA